MKPAFRMAGLFASGSFVLVVYTAYFNSLDPMKTLELGGLAFLVCGFLGFQLGQVFEDGARQYKKRKRREAIKAQLAAQEAKKEAKKQKEAERLAAEQEQQALEATEQPVLEASYEEALSVD